MNTAPICEESVKISYAGVGKLETVCPTKKAVDELIHHVRSCDACRHVLAYIRESEQTFNARDAAFFEELKDVPAPQKTE